MTYNLNMYSVYVYSMTYNLNMYSNSLKKYIVKATSLDSFKNESRKINVEDMYGSFIMAIYHF